MWLSAGILHRDKTHKGAGQSGGWCPFSGETLSLGGAAGLTFAQMRKSDGRTEWCNVTFCFLYVPHLQAKKKNTYRRRMTAWLRWEPSSAPWLVATFSTSVQADVGHGEISVISGTLTDSVPFCCCFFYGSRAGGAGWTLGDPSSRTDPVQGRVTHEAELSCVWGQWYRHEILLVPSIDPTSD